MKVNNLLLAQALYRMLNNIIARVEYHKNIIGHACAEEIIEVLNLTKKIESFESYYHIAIEDLILLLKIQSSGKDKGLDFVTGLEDLIISGLTFLKEYLSKFKEIEEHIFKNKLDKVKKIKIIKAKDIKIKSLEN